MTAVIVQGLRDKTISIHSTVNFRCTSDQTSEMYWKYSVDKNVYIFDRRGRNEKLFGERFVRTMNNFTSILTIRNVQKSDEGTYICRESVPPGDQSYSRLTVTG